MIRGLVYLSTSYNPLAVIYKDKLKGTDESKVDQITAAAKSLSSESMNVTKGLERVYNFFFFSFFFIIFLLFYLEFRITCRSNHEGCFR